MPESLTSPDRLKAFRAQRKLSQSGFAALIKASPRTVEDWEAGRRAIPALLWFALRYIETQETLRRQIDLMRHGGMRVHDNNVDVTHEAIVTAEAQIAEFETLFAQMAWDAPDTDSQF